MNGMGTSNQKERNDKAWGEWKGEKPLRHVAAHWHSIIRPRPKSRRGKTSSSAERYQEDSTDPTKPRKLVLAIPRTPLYQLCPTCLARKLVRCYRHPYVYVYTIRGDDCTTCLRETEENWMVRRAMPGRSLMWWRRFVVRPGFDLAGGVVVVGVGCGV